MNLKFLAACLGALFVCSSAHSAEYKSDGISAKIAKNGYITELSYKNKVLLKNIQIEASYSLNQEEEKHDARFFQAWDYEGKADITENGREMQIRTKSFLGNSKIKKGAEYESSIFLSPNELVIKSKITTLVDLKTQMHLFRHDFVIPEENISGRGLKATGADGLDSFLLIPATYSKNFKVPPAKNISISIQDYILSFSADQKGTVYFSDCRAWNEKSILITVNYSMKWTPELVSYPSGTVFEWESKITIIPD